MNGEPEHLIAVLLLVCLVNDVEVRVESYLVRVLPLLFLVRVINLAIHVRFWTLSLDDLSLELTHEHLNDQVTLANGALNDPQGSCCVVSLDEASLEFGLAFLGLLSFLRLEFHLLIGYFRNLLI